MLVKRVAPPVTIPRETPETFRLLVEGIQDFAIFMLDGAGRVATWNTGAERIKGYRAEEIVGQHFSRFYPPEAVAEGKPARLLALAARDGRVDAEGRLPLLGRRDHHGAAGFRGGGDRVREGDPRLDGSQGSAGRAESERTDLPTAGGEHPGLRHFHARPRRAGRQLERQCGAHQGVPRPR